MIPAKVESQELLESAFAYHEAGVRCIPIPSGTKAAKVNWTDERNIPLTPDQIRRAFSDYTNIAGLDGSTSGNLVTIDVDHLHRFNQGIARNRLFSELRNATWESLSASGRPHIHFRSPYPVRSRNHNRDKGFEIRGEGAYVLMPPSVFQKNGQGLLYTWIRRNELLSLSDTDIKTLSGVLPLERWEPSNRELNSWRPFGFSWKLWDAFRNGNFASHGYGKGIKGSSLSELDFHIALHGISQGWDDPELVAFFEEYSHPATRYRSEPHYRRRWYLEHTIQNARRHNATSRTDEQTRIQSWAELFPRIDWKQISGRTATTDSIVFQYLLTIAQRTGRAIFAASSREVAENTGIDRRTVDRTINRLHGLINTKGTDAGGIRELEIRPVSKCPIPTQWGSVCMGQNETDPAHPAWRTGKGKNALGKSGRLVWEYLNQNPGKKAESIASGTQVSRPTVFRKLQRMAEIAIVTVNMGHWYPEDVSEDQIADRLGTSELAARQREQHQKDRDLRRKYAKASPEERKRMERVRDLRRMPGVYELKDGSFVDARTGRVLLSANEKS